MNDPLSMFRAVLKSFWSSLQVSCVDKNAHGWLKATHDTKTKETLNEILIRKSSNMIYFYLGLL